MHLLAVLLSSRPRLLGSSTDGRRSSTVQVLGTRKMTNKPGVERESGQLNLWVQKAYDTGNGRTSRDPRLGVRTKVPQAVRCVSSLEGARHLYYVRSGDRLLGPHHSQGV